jgi:hypothetical protein
LPQGSVWAVPVVEGFELAERVQEVPLVPDQRTVEELVPAGLYPALQRSMTEFIRGIWMPVVTTFRPASVIRVSKARTAP